MFTMASQRSAFLSSTSNMGSEHGIFLTTCTSLLKSMISNSGRCSRDNQVPSSCPLESLVWPRVILGYKSLLQPHVLDPGQVSTGI